MANLRNVFLLAATVVLSLLGVEAMARIALNPTDFLQPNLIPDQNLKYRIAPYSGGHDAWGFRNGSVPPQADILAIGDSFTYGMPAPSYESWPAWLARRSGRSVYNMGLGGYGPVEYRKLLETYGAQLTPRVVVIALYLGNDLYDSYVSASGQIDPEIQGYWQRTGASEQVRDWLSKHSILYGMVKLALPRLVSFFRVREGVQKLGTGVIMVDVAGQKVMLMPRLLHRLVDVKDDRIVMGLKRTKEEIREIAKICQTNLYKCYFVIIPTKEFVAWPLVKQSLSDTDRHDLEEMVGAELAASQELKTAIANLDLMFIDPLDDLRLAWGNNAIYPQADPHLNGSGYAVIAKNIWKTIAAEAVSNRHSRAKPSRLATTTGR